MRIIKRSLASGRGAQLLAFVGLAALLALERSAAPAEAADACKNAADVALWTNTPGTAHVLQCVGDCLFASNSTCATSCVADNSTVAFTAGCAECVAGIADCARVACPSKCANIASAPCASCVDRNCLPSFKVCSGLNDALFSECSDFFCSAPSWVLPVIIACGALLLVVAGALALTRCRQRQKRVKHRKSMAIIADPGAARPRAQRAPKGAHGRNERFAHLKLVEPSRRRRFGRGRPVRGTRMARSISKCSGTTQRRKKTRQKWRRSK